MSEDIIKIDLTEMPTKHKLISTVLGALVGFAASTLVEKGYAVAFTKWCARAASKAS